MKPLDIYLEFGVDQYNVRSREAEDVVTRFAIRKILRERGLTLREIGRIEASIDGLEPVHHSSIIKSLRSEDRRVLDEVARIKDELEKWELAEKNATSVDIKKALRDAGARKVESGGWPIPVMRDATSPNSIFRNGDGEFAGDKMTFEQKAGIYNVHVYSGAYGEQLREAKRQYEETGTFDANLLIQRSETATERAIREKRQHKEALDRMKMRIDEQKSEAQAVIQKLSEDVAEPRIATPVVVKPKSLLTRIMNYFKES